MNCSTCQNPVPDGATYCVQCGARVGSPQPVATGHATTDGRTALHSTRADLNKTRTMTRQAEPKQPGAQQAQAANAQRGIGRARARYASDIVILFDCTGSMGPYIEGMKNMAIAFSRDLEANNIDARLGLVEYRDVKIGEPTNVHGFATSPEAFRGEIASLSASGGGDEPESAIDAGISALNEMPFRNDATKVFVWITDASYHEPAENGMTLEGLVHELVSNRIIAYVIGPELPGYLRLTDCMGGILFNIGKNPDEFRRIVSSLGKSISETVPRMRDIRSAADTALGRTRTW